MPRHEIVRTHMSQYPETTDGPGVYLPTQEEIAAHKKVFWEQHLEGLRNSTSEKWSESSNPVRRRFVHKKKRA